MEEAVRRARDRLATTASDPRGGEREAQATGRRPEPGQEDAAGRALKKTLRPAVQRVLVREVQVAYRESRTSNLSGAPVFPNDYRYRSRRNPRAERTTSRPGGQPGALWVSETLGSAATGRMAREQEARVLAVLRRRPGNQSKKATSTEKRSSFVKLVRWLSMPMTAGAWTSYPISWSAGSDSGC